MQDIFDVEYEFGTGTPMIMYMRYSNENGRTSNNYVPGTTDEIFVTY
jgi:hypothetical protein